MTGESEGATNGGHQLANLLVRDTTDSSLRGELHICGDCHCREIEVKHLRVVLVLVLVSRVPVQLPELHVGSLQWTEAAASPQQALAGVDVQSAGAVVHVTLVQSA